MIVKNESRVIRKCLETVKPLIDSWVIVDTGSTDGTQAIIQEVLQDKPGKLYERPWVDFAHNRNEALSLAQNMADYLLFIDADEVLTFSPEFTMPSLNKDCYFITVRENGADYQRLFLIDARLPWRWEGVLHETLLCEQAQTFDRMTGVINFSTSREGGRSQDAEKYLKDAQILEAALKKDPTHARYTFYLAQSYYNAQKYDLSLQTYQKRASMGGWEEEIFWSLYQIGILQERLKMDAATVINSYKKAYQYRPSRMEPLYRLATYYLAEGDPFLGFFIAKEALSASLPSDHVFVEKWIYSYGIWLTFANCAYEIRKYKEAESACKHILLQEELPSLVRERVISNLHLLTYR